VARSFNGTSDVLKCSVGSPINVGFGTFAAIVNITSFSATRSIMRLATSTPTNVLGFSVNTSGQLIMTDGTSAPSGTTALVAGEWYLIAAGKATGTTTPRYHIYRYSTDAWVHENAVGTVANATVPSTTGRMNLMARAADQFTPGDLAAAGFWGRNLSDAEVEQLPFSLQGWHATAPNGLWLLDQGSTSQNVPDLTGSGGNQASLTGTTVSTNSVPVFGYGSDVVKPYAIPPNVANIVFRALGTTSKVASGNMSPGLPAGTAQNDIVVLVTSQQDNVSCSVTGYTRVSAVNNTTNCRQEIWIKRAGASESAPTVSHTGGGVSNAVIAAYSGVDTGLTIGVGAGAVVRDLQTASGAAASTTCTGPALTGVVLYDMRIFAGMFAVNDTSGVASNNWTTVSGFTEERDDCSALTGAWATSFAYDDVRATGSAGSITSTCNGGGFTATTLVNIGCQLALSSDVSGGGTPTIAASGAASDERSGASALTTTASATPAASKSDEAAGVSMVAQVVIGPAAASSEGAGQPVILAAATLAPGPSASGESSGPSVVAAAATVSPGGARSSEGVGAAAISALATVSSSAVATSEVVATSGVAPGTVSIAPGGTSSSESAGGPAVTATATIQPNGVRSSEASGASSIGSLATIAPVGIATSEAAATSAATPGAVQVAPAGAATSEAVGSSVIVTAPPQTVSPSGAPSSEGAGPVSIAAAATIAGSGTPSIEGAGTSMLTPGAVQLGPAGAPSGEGAGTTGVSAAPSQTIAPAGAVSQATTGQSSISTIAVISFVGVDSAEQAGRSQVAPGAVTIQSSGAASGEQSAASLLAGTVLLTPAGVVSEERVAPSVIGQLVVIAAAGAPSGEGSGSGAMIPGGVAIHPGAGASAEMVGATMVAMVLAEVPGVVGIGSSAVGGVGAGSSAADTVTVGSTTVDGAGAGSSPVDTAGAGSSATGLVGVGATP
jgi:hypothetical protein